jgi:nitrate reductase delta subunit
VELLGEPVDVIATIGARLKKKASPYAVLFEALVSLSKAKPKSERVSELLAATPDEDSLEALDKEWEEAAAFDGPPGQAACQGCAAPGQSSQDGLQIKISQVGS